MTDLAIRPAVAADADAIAAIYNHYVANTVITFEEEPVAAAAMAARISEVLGQGLPWLVAEHAGLLVGYSYATKWKTRSAYRHSVETTIYLRHGSEGCGIGKTLYAALLASLKRAGIHAVIGGAAMPNPASVALHEKLGFEHVGTFRQVGFKQGRWVDVAYWQLPMPPVQDMAGSTNANNAPNAKASSDTV
jgi:phosphinothricin acetyltransferase